MKYRIKKKYYKTDVKIEHTFQIEGFTTIKNIETKKISLFKIREIETESKKWSEIYNGYFDVRFPNFKTLKEARDWIIFTKTPLPEDKIIK